MLQILDNINSIQIIETRFLRHITIIPDMGVMLNFWRNFIELPLVNLASMEVASQVENKSRLFTTTIKGLLSEHFNVGARKLAFLVTTVMGDRFLVGTNESPFPITHTSDIFPDKSSDPSGCTLTVEYTDTIGLLPVLDWDSVFLSK